MGNNGRVQPDTMSKVNVCMYVCIILFSKIPKGTNNTVTKWFKQWCIFFFKVILPPLYQADSQVIIMEGRRPVKSYDSRWDEKWTCCGSVQSTGIQTGMKIQVMFLKVKATWFLGCLHVICNDKGDMKIKNVCHIYVWDTNRSK